MMEIAISTGLYYKKGYKEILDIIAETGCKNIELFINQAFIDVPLQDIVKAVEERDLQVTSIHTPLYFIRESRGESESYWIEKCMVYAKKLGAEIIVSHSMFSNNNDQLVNVDSTHKKNILKYNNDNILICTENMPKLPIYSFLQDKDELLDFIETNKCYMTYDTTHWSAWGYDLVEGYNFYNQYIKNIHLSDFKDDIQHLALGKGNQPIEELMDRLITDNYTGLLTLELDFDNEKRSYIQKYDEAVSELKDALQLIHKRIEKVLLKPLPLT